MDDERSRRAATAFGQLFMTVGAERRVQAEREQVEIEGRAGMVREGRGFRRGMRRRRILRRFARFTRRKVRSQRADQGNRERDLGFVGSG